MSFMYTMMNLPIMSQRFWNTESMQESTCSIMQYSKRTEVVLKVVLHLAVSRIRV